MQQYVFLIRLELDKSMSETIIVQKTSLKDRVLLIDVLLGRNWKLKKIFCILEI